MYKTFAFLFFLVLFSGSSGQTIGQVTGNESRPTSETNTEADRLLQEGIELTGAGQFPQAVRALEEAIRLDPHYANAYAALGRAYFKMRLWRKAVDNLHRAAELRAAQRQAGNAPPQKSAMTKPNANQMQTLKILTEKVPALLNPKLPQQNQNFSSEARSISNSATTEVPVFSPPQIEATTSTRQPDPPQPATLKTNTQPQKIPDLNAPEISTSPTPALKFNAVEVTQPTAPEAEKAAVEAPLKNDAAKASEEMPQPTGVSLSMSAPPASITVESRGVSPIPLEPSNEDVSLTKIYRVGPNDVLDVRINEAQSRQSTLFTVTSMGLLEHPMLAEPLNVSGLTTEEIETKFQDDLKKRALIEDSQVTVGVRDYASHAILVSGLVKESGTRILRREAIPLYVVVADAQPLPEAAKVTVVRNELNQMFEIDLTKVADMSLLIRSGDVINLQRNETQFVYVGGEVKTPGEKIFRRGLTLMQAILAAGGMTPKSKSAELSRDDGRGFLVKTSFKLEDIHTGKAVDPLIRPGDRILILR